MSELELLIRNGYKLKDMDKAEVKDSTNFTVIEEPVSENRQDKAVFVQNKSNDYMRISNIMMGYNKQNIKLPDGTYVDITDIEAAMNRYVEANKENTLIFVKRTGKRIDIHDMKAAIMEALKKAASIKLNGRSDKIMNQETQTYSIKGENSSEYYDKGVFMFGNKGMNIPQSEYYDVDKFYSEFDKYATVEAPTVEPPIGPPVEPEPPVEPPVGPEPIVEPPVGPEPPVEPDPGDEIIDTIDVPDKFKKHKKIIQIIGLASLVTALGAILVPGVMYANSILWKNIDIPLIRTILHGINIPLGKLIGATFDKVTGLWTAPNGFLINGTAAQQNILVGLGIHGINGVGIGLIKKIIDKIKRKVKDEDIINNLDNKDEGKKL